MKGPRVVGYSICGCPDPDGAQRLSYSVVAAALSDGYSTVDGRPCLHLEIVSPTGKKKVIKLI
jgi:hypothetical protein